MFVDVVDGDKVTGNGNRFFNTASTAAAPCATMFGRMLRKGFPDKNKSFMIIRISV